MGVFFGLLFTACVIGCWFVVYLCGKKGVQAESDHRNNPDAKFWREFPMGLGPMGGVFVAGFSTFPVINTLILLLILIDSIIKMERSGVSFEQIIQYRRR